MEQALVIKHLYKSFGEHTVLKDINLIANKGDVIALLGPSGSGKSTLLRCINLLTIPDGGDIYIGSEHLELTRKRGQTVVKSPQQLQKFRTTCGMVFQQFNLWAHKTVIENIIEAPIYVLQQPREMAIANAEQLLKKVGLANKADNYPAQLSGGQQQRVAIARALAMQPMLILFDEPTSALDPEMVTEVLNVMRAIAEEGTTMLVATHEIGFAKDVADKILFLEHGEIQLAGDPRKLFKDKTLKRFHDFIQTEQE